MSNSILAEPRQICTHAYYHSPIMTGTSVFFPPIMTGTNVFRMLQLQMRSSSINLSSGEWTVHGTSTLKFKDENILQNHSCHYEKHI